MADQEACSRIERQSVIKCYVANERKAVKVDKRRSTVYGATCYRLKMSTGGVGCIKWTKKC